MLQVLLNPLADNKQGGKLQETLPALIDESAAELGFEKSKVVLNDITTIKEIGAFLATLSADDVIILAGGDGTLNRFVNDIGDKKIAQKIFFYSAGSGNDFLHDITATTKIVNNFVPLNSYIEGLPTVTVNGITRKFINGIGYGIDGYCCEVGDKLRETSDKPVNYAGIAIKGLLFHFKPANAKVTVDGVSKTYKKAWLAPTMIGRYYGGGMMVAPAQDRKNAEHTVTNVVMYGSGKLKTLMVFPSIFKGEHISHTEMVDIRAGHEITVEFDKPIALQIDGETVLGVTSYSVSYK